MMEKIRIVLHIEESTPNVFQIFPSCLFFLSQSDKESIFFNDILDVRTIKDVSLMRNFFVMFTIIFMNIKL